VCGTGFSTRSRVEDPQPHEQTRRKKCVDPSATKSVAFRMTTGFRN